MNMSTFLESYIESKGYDGAGSLDDIISLEYFAKNAEFKDAFEFSLWCYDKDGKYNRHYFLGDMWLIFRVNDYLSDESYELLSDYYNAMLGKYMKERNINLVEKERNNTKIYLFEETSVTQYLVDFYEKDYNSLFYIDEYFYENDWVWCMDNLTDKVNEVFLREWNKLKISLGFDESYSDRARLFGLDPFQENCLKEYNNIDSNFYCECGKLGINRKFIQDNKLATEDELTVWLEGIVNLALKELGVRYDKEKINCMENWMDREAEQEAENEVGR